MTHDQKIIEVLEKYGWYLTDEKSKINLRNQLVRELPLDHILYGKLAELEIFAKTDSSDDILLLNSLGNDDFYLVHLTWAKRPSNLSSFPFTQKIQGVSDLGNTLKIRD